MFEEESGYAPPHLAPANAAADEYEERVGAAVAPTDHDKVRLGRGAGWAVRGGAGGWWWWDGVGCGWRQGARAAAAPGAHSSQRSSTTRPDKQAATTNPTRLRVRYLLKNVARDWSAEGAAERAASYGRITRELQRLFGGWDPGAAEPPAVLVPGAGLARLCLEITNLVGGGGSVSRGMGWDGEGGG